MTEHGPEAFFDEHGSTEQFPPDAPPPRRVRSTAWHWIDPEKIPRRQWLYGTSVIRKFVSATIAPGGAGKSSLAVVEVLEMVSGKELLLDVAHAPLRVWYWNLEDPKEEIERRLAAACAYYKLEADDLVGRLELLTVL